MWPTTNNLSQLFSVLLWMNNIGKQTNIYHFWLNLVTMQNFFFGHIPTSTYIYCWKFVVVTLGYFSQKQFHLSLKTTLRKHEMSSQTVVHFFHSSNNPCNHLVLFSFHKVSMWGSFERMRSTGTHASMHAHSKHSIAKVDWIWEKQKFHEQIITFDGSWLELIYRLIHSLI